MYKNLIINGSFDDGIEPSGFCQNCSVHGNHLRNSSQAIRLKIEDNEGNAPLYVYKNVIYNQDRYDFIDYDFYSNQTTLFYHTTTTVPIYFYHNLFLGLRCIIQPTGNLHIGRLNLFFINNIFSCRYSMPNARLLHGPKFYDRSLIEYNELGEQVSIESEKIISPCLLVIGFGGQKDHRDAVVGLDGRPRALFENHLLYLFPEIPGLENIFQNKYVDYATHIFDSFGQDRESYSSVKTFVLNRVIIFQSCLGFFYPFMS